MSVTNKASIIAVIGASGSGKGVFIKKKLRSGKPQRLIIFDPMGEYGEFATIVTKMADVVAAVKNKQFKIALKPDNAKRKEQFNLLCKIAYSLGACWFVVDELSLVTKANFAPENWQDVSMRGRHKGMTVIGASQRPASIDKDFFGNATTIRTGRLNFAADVKTMANVLRVPGHEISELNPLHYIERDMNTGNVTRGVLKI